MRTVRTLWTDAWRLLGVADEARQAERALPQARVVRVVANGAGLRLGAALGTDVVLRADASRRVVVRVWQVRTARAVIAGVAFS